MIDLSTRYMGFELKNPIIASSSGMTDTVDKIKNLEANGVSAVVLKSLFEEEIMMEMDQVTKSNLVDTYGDAQEYLEYYTRKHNIDKYLKLIEESKESVDIPVIASLNSFSIGQWVNFAEKLESAGADGLELNMFILPGDQKFSGKEIEQIYFDIIRSIRKNTKLPIAVKLSTYFSGMADTLIKMSKEDISSMVLFNRFYSPDVDLEKEEIVSSRIFSLPEENSMCIRWIGMISDKVNCDLAASTGIVDGYDVLKNLMVGAKAVQVASTLYKNTAKQVGVMLHQIEHWMKHKNYNSLDEIIGKLSYKNVNKPMLFERAQFMKYFYGES